MKTEFPEIRNIDFSSQNGNKSAGPSLTDHAASMCCFRPYTKIDDEIRIIKPHEIAIPMWADSLADNIHAL